MYTNTGFVCKTYRIDYIEHVLEYKKPPRITFLDNLRRLLRICFQNLLGTRIQDLLQSPVSTNPVILHPFSFQGRVKALSGDTWS